MDSNIRIVVPITREEQTRMRNLIPWGNIGRVVRILLFQVLDLVEQHGEVALGAILSGDATVLDIMKKRKEDKGEHRRSKEVSKSNVR